LSELGLAIKGAPGGKRIVLSCQHQSGVLYSVPGESSWVCSDELLHVHALAGFMKELVHLDDTRVKEAMKRWGLYYRERPVADDDAVKTDS